MNPEQYKLIQQAVNESLAFNPWFLLILSFIAAGLGAYVGSYLKTKGKNLATKEDFDQVLDQLRKQTEATEEIKGKVAEQIESVKAHYQESALRLQNELQSSSEKALHLYRVGFEREFNIYQDLWAQCSSVCDITETLRDARSKAAWSQASRDFDRTINMIEEIIKAKGPFFSEEIAKRASNLLGIAKKVSESTHRLLPRRLEECGPSIMSPSEARGMLSILRAASVLKETIRCQINSEKLPEDWTRKT